MPNTSYVKKACDLSRYYTVQYPDCKPFEFLQHRKIMDTFLTSDHPSLGGSKSPVSSAGDVIKLSETRIHGNQHSSSSSEQDVEVVAISSDVEEKRIPQTQQSDNRKTNLNNGLVYHLPPGGAAALDHRTHEHQLLMRYHQERNSILSSRQSPHTEVLPGRNMAGDEGVSMRVSESTAQVLAVPL